MYRRILAPTLALPLFLLFAVPGANHAAAATGHSMQLRYSLRFSENDLNFRSAMGYDLVMIKDGGGMSTVGSPMLPLKEVRIALPEGMRATDVHVVGMETREIQGTFTIYPAQPPLPVGTPPGAVPFVEPDPVVYSSTEAYPPMVAELSGQTDLAGQAMACVKVYPLRYVPAEGRLALLTSIDLVIDGVDGYVCGDYLPIQASDAEREAYEHMVRGMVDNPDAVTLRTAGTYPHTLALSSGDYEYVVITQDTWTSDFQPLVDWKTKKGVPATIVTTGWIYGQYSGSSNAEKIRAFVQDAHNTWGTIYFLLGGDTNVVPYYTRNIGGDNIPGDTYYGDYDYDWTCEVDIGRASVRNTSAISTFIGKVLTYEKTPPLTNYALRVGLFGFDLYTNGSNEGEGCKTAIDNLYIPAGWNVNSVYDSDSGNHETKVINTMNSGQNLLNHIDHSSSDYMGTGYINHWWGLYSSDMDNLYNGDRQSIFYSIGCDACQYDASNCIAEHFVRNAAGGGVAFIGNSRYGWYSPWNDDYYSLRYDRYFFRSLFSQGHYHLGDCFSDHKNDGYQNDDTYRYIFYELTLLGDPELPVWTGDPQTLDSVTFPDSIPLGSQYVTVTVEDGGSPVVGATVCLMKGTETYATGTTGSDGSVTLSVNPLSQGTMDVTVTARDYLPYEGTCQVAGEVPSVSVTIVPDTTEVPQGGLLGYTVTVTNLSSVPVTLDYWTDIVLWNGNPYSGNPIFGPFTGSLDVGATQQGHLYEPVPAGAPLETYTCYGRVGGYPGAVWAEDSFQFTVTAP